MGGLEFQIARAVVARAHGPTGGLARTVIFPGFAAVFHSFLSSFNYCQFYAEKA